MDLKDLKILTDYELNCMYESAKDFVAQNDDKDCSILKNLLLLLEIEIHNRNSDKE
ncbi:hypothetical protein [Salipaludibacillus sp. CF4.18]|uniref:hypothetical protein n=1 Tax=Salipaludibacillus sp. CF4.18 TaxID=3373081 RepID=UPI003EE70409